MGLFTERHNMKTEIEKTSTISTDMYSVLLGCCVKYYKYLTHLFPLNSHCDFVNQDYLEFNKTQFESRMKIKFPALFRNEYNSITAPQEYDEYDQYALIDFIEFIGKNIKDIFEGWNNQRYKNYWYIECLETSNIYDDFQSQVNEIFEEGRLLFKLTDEKIIKIENIKDAKEVRVGSDGGVPYIKCSDATITAAGVTKFDEQESTGKNDNLSSDNTPKTFPPSNVEKQEKRFAIAFSFPGEYREMVKQIAESVATIYTEKRVLYDYFHRAEFARPNLDVYLQNLYRNESELNVIFICAEYNKKEWCGIEWRAIRDLLNSKEADDKIMFVKCGDGSVDGVFGTTDGYIDSTEVLISDVVNDIIKRHSYIVNNNLLGCAIPDQIENDSCEINDDEFTVQSNVAFNECVFEIEYYHIVPSVPGKRTSITSQGKSYTNGDKIECNEKNRISLPEIFSAIAIEMINISLTEIKIESILMEKIVPSRRFLKKEVYGQFKDKELVKRILIQLQALNLIESQWNEQTRCIRWSLTKKGAGVRDDAFLIRNSNK